MNAEILVAREYGTDRPCEIGRLEEDGCVTLTFRYTDEPCEWFPTWVGPKGGAVRVPEGWSVSPAMLEALESAPRRETFPGDGDEGTLVFVG